MHTARESMARRVLVMEYARIASAIPGTSRSQTARVALGCHIAHRKTRSAAGEHDIGVRPSAKPHNGITNLADVIAHDHM